MADSLSLPASRLETLVQPYKPSWVDRLTNWIERRPFPAWAFYVGLAVALVGLEVAVKFVDGTYPERFRVWHISLSIAPAAPCWTTLRPVRSPHSGLL